MNKTIWIVAVIAWTVVVSVATWVIVAPSSPVAQQEPVRTASWYVEHEAEYQAQMKRCLDNPGELGNTPNCINARQAASMILHRVPPR